MIFDATQVRANADVDSLVPRFYWKAKAHLAALFAEPAIAPESETAAPTLASGPEPATQPDAPGQSEASAVLLPTALSPQEEGRLAEENRAAWNLLEQRRLDAERPVQHGYQRLTALRVSTTDPDAALMRLKGGGMRLGYHDHYVVDGGKCPQGHPLRRRSAKYAQEVVVYRARAATCNSCPVKAACTDSDQGRQVHRSFDAEYLERVRGYHDTPAYQKAMRKRQVWVEPLFGEAKDWHGLRRFRLRGLPKVNGEALLIAAGQNLKRLLQRRGWGRRPWPGPATTLSAPFLV